MSKQPPEKGKIYGLLNQNIFTIQIGKFYISFGKYLKEYRTLEELKEALIEGLN